MARFNNIFLLMEEKGVQAKELSEMTGISPGNISDWKSGRSAPKADTLIKIADYLNCSVDYLLGRETNTENNLSNSATGNKNFIENIEQLCQKKNVSVSQMTSDLGLAVGIVSNWRKRGTLPSGEVILKIADYFDC